MPGISTQGDLHTPQYEVLNNGTFLTVIDSRRQALFTIQHPFRHAVQYTRTGNQLFLTTECCCTQLWSAPDEAEAQRVLDTLLRGLMNMLRFRRACLMVLMTFIGTCAVVWFSELIQTASPVLSLMLPVTLLIVALLSLSVLTVIRHSGHKQKAKRANTLTPDE